MQNIPHYRYQLKIDCGCSLLSETPITIEVLDGKIVSVVDVGGQLSDWSNQNSRIFGEDQTIKGLFGQIQKQIYKHDYYLWVKYDGKYGFPQFFLFKPEFTTYGGGVMYQVSNFEVLP